MSLVDLVAVESGERCDNCSTGSSAVVAVEFVVVSIRRH